jgi:N-acetylmuramoyl-L-alanine amidase
MWQSLQRRTMVCTLVLAGLASAQPVHRSSVTAIRFWSFGDTTRVVVETTGEFQLHSDRVGHPDRLFFDLMGARMRLGRKGQHTIQVGDRLLKQIRVAETLPAVTRVVFDLETGVDFNASQLTNPDRLIIELRPPAAVTPPVAPDATPRLTPHTETQLPSSTSSVPAKVSVSDLPVLPSATADPVPVALKSTPRVETLPEPKMTVAPALPKQTPRTAKLPDPTNMKDRAAAALATPKPAKLTGSQSLTRVLGLKVGRIVIDPGHGGYDTGTAGPAGLYEKDLVLDLAQRLGALIEKRMGAEVVYTRSDDTFIPLESRTHIANQRRADLFLSIHANSSPARNSSGVETYYLSFTTSKSALEVAARENASSQKAVYELQDLLQKIALQDKVDESREFASKVQQALYASSARANSRTRDRGVKKAPFVVLIGASMPSVLAEVGFISNPKDEALFRKPEFRQKIAEGLYKGLSQYASTLSQSQVAKN